jgi:hypothetical protein
VSSDKPHVAGVITDDGNYAVWSLSAVRAPSVATETEQQRQARQQQTARQTGNEEFAIYLKEGERTSKILRNERVFE